MAGHIRPKGEGVWEVIVATGRDPVTGRYGQKSRTVRGPAKAAKAELARLILEVDAGGHAGTNATVAQLMARWLPELARMGRRPGTRAAYEVKVRLYILPAIGDVPLRKVTPTMINDLYASMSKAGLKPRTVAATHAAMSSAFSEAVRWGWLDRNPAHVARASIGPTAEPEVPTPAQVRILLSASRDGRNPDLHSLIYTAAVTGARRGELCALRWTDIRGRTVEIARSLIDVRTTNAAYAFRGDGPTKNGKPRRVSLDSSTQRVLADHHDKMTERANTAGTVLRPDGYVWALAPDGGRPYLPNTISNWFTRFTAKTLGSSMRFHSLRHFAVTQALTAGVPVHIVAQRTGDNPSVMMHTYAHWLPDNDAAAAEHLGSLMIPPTVDEWSEAQADTAELLRKLQEERPQ